MPASFWRKSAWDADLVVAADAGLLAAAAGALGLPLAHRTLRPLEDFGRIAPGTLKVLHIPTARAVVPGRTGPAQRRLCHRHA